MNDTLLRVADVNGISTLVINGTLSDGTEAAGDSSSHKRNSIIVGVALGVFDAVLLGIITRTDLQTIGNLNNRLEICRSTGYVASGP